MPQFNKDTSTAGLSVVNEFVFGILFIKGWSEGTTYPDYGAAYLVSIRHPSSGAGSVGYYKLFSAGGNAYEISSLSYDVNSKEFTVKMATVTTRAISFIYTS